MFNILIKYKTAFILVGVSFLLLVFINVYFTNIKVDNFLSFVRNVVAQKELEIIKDLTNERDKYKIQYDESLKKLNSLENDKIVLLKNYTIIHQRLNIINKSIDELKNKPKEKLPEGIENVFKMFQDMGYSVSIMDCK